MGDNIKVAVRLRKLIKREIQAKADIFWDAKDERTVRSVASTSSLYSYDRVFDRCETNRDIFTEFCAPIVESVIKGFNGTIFAYGQTSSGKTYTLMGGEFEDGIATYIVRDVFEKIQTIPDREFLVRVSFMEIDKEKVTSLPNKSNENLKIQEDQNGNFQVQNLPEIEVQEPDQVLHLLRKCRKSRKSEETAQNQRSSRSHLIFRMIIESRLRGDENAAVNVSHFNIVDLAGSEKPSENSGKRFTEGVNINKSLFFLCQVISQLSSGKESQHVKYRDSTLTKILKNSLGGNALTAIICNITPASNEETLSTLKFALNAKKIKNKPRVNEIETEEALIKSYANKIQILTKQLELTKKEKDQEAKERQDMQEQIEVLKKKFVKFVPQDKRIARNNRRETWGGHSDIALLNSLLQSSRPLKLSVVDEENEVTVNGPEVSSQSYIELTTEEDKLKQYENKIAELEKELTELKNFTTLEKQLMSDEQNSEIVRKSSSDATTSPVFKKSRKSYVDDLTVDEESFGIINSFVNQKSGANPNIIDLDQEMFLQNLNIMIEKLNSVLNIEALPLSIANPNHKVIYLLTNAIFQRHLFGREVFIEEQVKEILTMMYRIFVGFNNQEDSTMQNSELIMQFDEKLEKLLKDIENGFAVNSKNLLNETHSVQTKGVNLISDVINASCSKSPDVDVTETYDKECETDPILIATCQCKDQIASLEETINTHLKTINNLQSNCELIKKQLNLSEDKIKIQEQVIASFETEVKLKGNRCAEVADNSTQTSYMPLLCESDKKFTKKIYPRKGSNEDSKTEERNCSNCSLDENSYLLRIKSKLCEMKLLAHGMMEESMPKVYGNGISINESSDVTLHDFISAEMATLNDMLHKIRLYLESTSERSQLLEKEMLGKMVEISTLQMKCSSSEKKLHEKENQWQKLNTELCRFREEVSGRWLSFRAELMCHDEDKFEDNITYLKRIMQSLMDVVKEKICIASKDTKITQTVDNYPDLAALEEIRACEFKERQQLLQKNTSLKLEVENLSRKVEGLEEDLQLKEDKISEIMTMNEEEVKHLKDAMQKNIKNIEDKYEEELKNQEKSLFDMVDEKLRTYRRESTLQREKDQQEFKKLEEGYEKLISELNKKYETSKSNFDNKLKEELDNNLEKMLKLQAEIREFKIKEEKATTAYYMLKGKFKEYVQNVRNMRLENAKFVKEKGTQTSSDSSSQDVVCNICLALKEEKKQLNYKISSQISEIASLKTKLNNMTSEIADLKKELTGKYALLQTCNCRLIAKPQELLKKVSHKTQNVDSKEVNLDEDQLRKSDSLEPREILKLECVQRAIKEAKESEREIFLRGEGPASEEMCIILRRKLAKKEKEISELKNIVSQKQAKAAPAKYPSERLNSENVPMHPIDAEFLDNFTPCAKTINKYSDGEVPEVRPKNILHEMNRPHDACVPRNKWFMTEQEAEKAKELDERLRKHRKDPDCKQQ